jgi:hypothetical protein
MSDYYDIVPGVYRDYQDYFGNLECQDNEWDSDRNDEWGASHLPNFNWEAVVSRLIDQLENAWDGNEIEAVMSKYSQTVIDIAWNRLSNRQKVILNALLTYL